ncbi:EthD family reductase [Geodermatophilus obscurus]|uniref:Ethyl tert-butyl ether degradation EthD n=1 Tax=Geodermatophilus obscurus (strain ATCC 25078 / DSM 43160 / JCM 3152 / CCUG 61914 / KCC A-0152 / KCTC 9177 / NBRC 13315 / NRRL B-3577 / G-20) TaxID=526225 RepID=D2SE71_GEOOG|nr:EthD family reductase [Geodermatophilus obscurus]ADB74543.1 Ethyl tert-butyl ether degradation EthD [Geodermatophilus obscurus DSM 43160]
MTHRLLVQYGRPTDPAAFDQHYRDVHVPLAQKIPGVVRFDIGHASPLDGDAAPYLVAMLDFESAEAFAAGMQSAEGAAAAGDVPNFATGGASMSHYDVEDFTA